MTVMYRIFSIKLSNIILKRKRIWTLFLPLRRALDGDNYNHVWKLEQDLVDIVMNFDEGEPLIR